MKISTVAFLTVLLIGCGGGSDSKRQESVDSIELDQTLFSVQYPDLDVLRITGDSNEIYIVPPSKIRKVEIYGSFSHIEILEGVVIGDMIFHGSHNRVYSVSGFSLGNGDNAFDNELAMVEAVISSGELVVVIENEKGQQFTQQIATDASQ